MKKTSAFRIKLQILELKADSSGWLTHLLRTQALRKTNIFQTFLKNIKTNCKHATKKEIYGDILENK